MNYKDYDIYDFLKDDDFRRWVFSPNERDDFFWKFWLNSYPKQAPVILEAREILLSIKFQEHHPNIDIQQEVLHNIYKDKRPARFQKKTNTTTKVFPTIIRSTFQARNIAAMVMLCVGAFFYWMLPLQKTPVKQQESVHSKLVVKTTPKGKKSNLKLKDGSKIKLNAETSLEFPETFSEQNRCVSMQSGEAFFEVERDTARPFLVKTEKIDITVLGTAFNVRYYPSDNTLAVAVTEGKVAVGKHGESPTFYLAPGEIAFYDKETQTFEKGNFDPEKVLAWKNGTIYFDEADMEEIVEKLERWYGVQFTVEGDLLNKRKFSGKFTNVSLKTVLETLSFASWFDYELEGKKVNIKMKSI